MTDAEKAAAFDDLALTLTNRWHDGKWSWWCPCAPGGDKQDDQTAAVADLVAWAKRMAERKRKRSLK